MVILTSLEGVLEAFGGISGIPHKWNEDSPEQHCSPRVFRVPETEVSHWHLGPSGTWVYAEEEVRV